MEKKPPWVWIAACSVLLVAVVGLGVWALGLPEPAATEEPEPAAADEAPTEEPEPAAADEAPTEEPEPVPTEEP